MKLLPRVLLVCCPVSVKGISPTPESKEVVQETVTILSVCASGNADASPSPRLSLRSPPPPPLCLAQAAN